MEFDGTALERAQAREARRIDPKVAMKPVEVRSLSDIQRVIAEFAPGAQQDGPPRPVSANLKGESASGSAENYKVSAVSRVKSRRTMILEGLELVRKYHEVVEKSQEESTPIEVNGVDMSPPALMKRNPSVYVDPMIRRWMGGVRRGLKICWDLEDGFTYMYDMFGNKLSRAKREE